MICSGCFARLLFLCSSQTTQRNPTTQHQRDFFIFRANASRRGKEEPRRDSDQQSSTLRVIIADFMYRLLSFYHCAQATVTLLISSLSFCVYPNSFFISGRKKINEKFAKLAGFLVPLKCPVHLFGSVRSVKQQVVTLPAPHGVQTCRPEPRRWRCCAPGACSCAD